MKPRVTRSLIFGVIFGIVLTGITLVVPTVTKYKCGGDTSYTDATYRLFSAVEFDLGDHCVGGGTTVQRGLPLGTRYKTSPPTINPELLTEEERNPQWETSISGIVGNFFIFTSFGFVLFFIFSPNQKTIEMRKSSKRH